LQSLTSRAPALPPVPHAVPLFDVFVARVPAPFIIRLSTPLPGHRHSWRAATALAPSPPNKPGLTDRGPAPPAINEPRAPTDADRTTALRSGTHRLQGGALDIDARTKLPFRSSCLAPATLCPCPPPDDRRSGRRAMGPFSGISPGGSIAVSTALRPLPERGPRFYEERTY